MEHSESERDRTRTNKSRITHVRWSEPRAENLDISLFHIPHIYDNYNFWKKIILARTRHLDVLLLMDNFLYEETELKFLVTDFLQK